MSRVQLALNVDDLDEAVDFYSKLFDTPSHKRRPGYANFAVDQPALKLVLIENRGQGGSLNHLGVEVASTTDVASASARLADEGLETRAQDQGELLPCASGQSVGERPERCPMGDIHGAGRQSVRDDICKHNRLLRRFMLHVTVFLTQPASNLCT